MQHAHNPVDWHAWSEAVFAKAVKENKPIFLSIGYSTCHWCHVMEEESFEDEKTAEFLNRDFIPIKVDREERPDIDHIYMDYVIATTGRGGWPMSVFLTPEKQPFYGGTYFPPEDRYGMPGFKTLLKSIADAWKTRNEEIKNSADSAVTYLKEKSGVPSSVVSLDKEVFLQAYEALNQRFDAQNGGFGPAPKFPMGHSLSFLLRFYKRSKEKRALELVETTLKKMATGGLYDALGGGFHRYSTDREWRIPHFEKMLYDQALLVKTYLEAYQVTKNSFYKKIASETLDYVLKDMTGPEGAFYSAEDADSFDEALNRKREGAFYVWTKKEIESILEADAPLFSYYYGIEESGNAIEDPHEEFTQQNVLYDAHSIQETADFFKKSQDEVERILKTARQRLKSVRSERSRPHLDDKILTDWNGLMIADFALAFCILGESRYLEAAQKAMDFILKKLKNEKNELLHRYRDNESAIIGNVDDYAFTIFALLSLYEADFKKKWVDEAAGLAEKMLELFWDNVHGGFYFSSLNAKDLITRSKISYDGAIPSGNSVAALCFLYLDRLTGETRYGQIAQKILSAFSSEILSQPASHSQMLAALDFDLGPSIEIIIAEGRNSQMLLEFLNEIYSFWIPNKVIMVTREGQKKPIEGRTAVYLCQNRACQKPVTDTPSLRQILKLDS